MGLATRSSLLNINYAVNGIAEAPTPLFPELRRGNCVMRPVVTVSGKQIAPEGGFLKTRRKTMLRARMNDGVFILGIDAENVNRLKNGQPILVCLAELGGTDDVLIIYGETLKDIQNELEAATGQPFPEPQTLSDARNSQ